MLISGAGPAGLMLANLLTRRGLPCTVLERLSRAETLSRARAGLLEERTVAALDDLGLAGRLRREGTLETTCEFRIDGRSLQIDYAKLCGGRSHAVWPQQEIVSDLLGAFEASGGAVRFGTEVVGVEAADAEVRVRTADGERFAGRLLAGADGTHGPSSACLPGDAIDIIEARHEFQWLAILAQAPPSADCIVYAPHRRGFAGHMPRSASVTRFYLQADARDGVGAWPDERVWEELAIRLHQPGWTLRRGPIVEKRLLDMRSVVREPLGHGRVVLLGDAAHVITPSGAKGMNLAIADAVELDRCLGRIGAEAPRRLLDAYSAARLPDVWSAQEFSHALLHMLHRYDEGTEQGRFRQRLQQTRLRQLQDRDAYARDFAERYVGPRFVREARRRGGRARRLEPARWSAAPPADDLWRYWTTLRGSLTTAIASRCEAVRVRPRFEGPVVLRADLAGRVGLPQGEPAYVRDVVISADGEPVVLARAALAERDCTGVWGDVRSLGDRPLADLVFAQPGIRRAAFEFQRVGDLAALVGSASSGVGAQGTGHWARRSTFVRAGRPLLLIEVFLPALARLDRADRRSLV